jgi:hypothetical protein
MTLVTLVAGCGADADVGAAGSDTSEDALKKKPTATGEATLKGLGCQERSGAPHALSIKWFPPASLDFVANTGRPYNETIPMLAKVSSSGVKGDAKYAKGGAAHIASLDVPRESGQGTFSIDGTTFEVECYYIETSTWEHH